MKRVIKILGLLILLPVAGLMSVGCSSEKDPVDPPKEEATVSEAQLAQLRSKAVDKVNAHVCDILSNTLANSDDSENVICSPLSCETMLGMLLNGASGETSKALLDYLAFSDVTETNLAYNSLMSQFTETASGAVVKVANSVWCSPTLNIKSDFQSNVDAYYSAETFRQDLGDMWAISAINEWVTKATDGQIPEYTKAAPNGDLLLLSALYFNSSWKIPFDVRATQKAEFQLSDLTTVSVDMMHSEYEYGYAAVDGIYQSICIPYAEEEFFLHLYLPASIDVGLEKIVSYLSMHSEALSCDSYTEKLCLIGVPKFTYSYLFPMEDYLNNNGLSVLFAGNANQFSNLASDPVSLVKFQQLCKIQVDEYGTIGAGVTEVGMITGEPNYLSVEFNRPFIFTIEHAKSGCVLFAGAVKNF